MSNFNEYLYQYNLHDCKIDDVIFDNNKIIFFFGAGVYELSPTGKEIQLTDSCRMTIQLEETNPQKIYDHIEITQIITRKIDEIDCVEFVDIVKKYKLDVDMNYYSRFCNTILLKGYINKARYELLISEVETVKFSFI